MRTYVHRDDSEYDGGSAGVAVCVRRTQEGVLVCSHAPVEGAAPLLVDLLDAVAGRARVLLEIRNDPAEPDFDAPHEETARLLIALLGQRSDEVLVTSRDWFAVERVRDAGIPTGFISAPGVSVGGGLAYVTTAGHRALLAHAGMIVEPEKRTVELISWGGEPAAEVDGRIVEPSLRR